MTIDDKTRDEKLQYDINRHAAKISALSSGKINININILQVKKYYLLITYSPLGKALEKQTKTIEDQGKKQIKANEDHGTQLVESNELIKKNLNIDRNSIPHEEQKKYLMNLINRERSSEINNLEKNN